MDLSQVDDYFNGGTKDFTGLTTVYVRFTFQHGTGATDEGVYVDNVALTGDNVVLPTISSMSPQGLNAGVGSSVTIDGANFGATQENRAGALPAWHVHGRHLVEASTS